MLLVYGDESAVQLQTFLFQHAYLYLNASVLQFLYASSVNLGKWVDTAHNHSPYTFLYNKVGAWRGLAIVGAWLKADIHSAFRQQLFIFRLNAGKGVYLGVPLAASGVVSLANDSSIVDNHRPHHWVGFCVLQSVGCQLQATSHIFLVVAHRTK